jgi:predicted tellurium resistance membrane protein TerC
MPWIDALVALVTLSAMEIVLGIDNLVFISVVTSKLPLEHQKRVRSLGIGLALFLRLALLFSIGWVMSLTQPLFNASGVALSGRDLILIVGGLFLIVKATFEIHDKVEGASDSKKTEGNRTLSPKAALFQIILLDIVFSLDSVITAVGMANHISVMVAAMLIAVGVMLFFAQSVHTLIQQHPTLVVLALSFLLLIGMTLLIEGFGGHVAKGYIYFAMSFSLGVEALNIRLRSKRQNLFP